MVADASIYSQSKPPVAAEGPLDQYAKVATLKDLMGRNNLQALQTTKLTRDMAEEEAYGNVLRNAPPGAKLEDLLPEAIKASPTRGVALENTILDRRQKEGNIAHTTAQTGEITAGHIASAFAALAKGNGSDEAVAQTEQMMAPYMGPNGAEKAKAISAQLLAMPPETRLAYAVAQAGQHKTGQEALKLFFPNAHMQDTGPGFTPVSTSTLPGGPAPGSTVPGGVVIPKTATPGDLLTDARVKSEGAANRGATATQGSLNRENHRLIAGVGPDGKPLNAVEPGEQIDLAKVPAVDLEAAHRYNADGTLPPSMGRGQQGAAESKRIRSIAAQLSVAAGIDPADVRANQLAFKGSGQAITQLVKKEAQVGANVRNFDFNAGQVLDLSQKVDRTGVPIINAWMNAGRRAVSGNPELAAFDTAVKTTVNEFAQIVSGTTSGASTQGEKEKAEKLLSAAQTPQQIIAVLNQMKIESQNRMKSFADQKKETLTTMRSGGKPAAAPANAVPAAGTVQDGYRFKGGDPSKRESWEKV